MSCANDDADIWFYLLSFAGTFIEDVKAMYKKDKDASGVFLIVFIMAIAPLITCCLDDRARQVSVALAHRALEDTDGAGEAGL